MKKVMSKKISITLKKAQEFNYMLATLKKISRGYMTTEQLRRNCEKEYGLEFEETIEMVYENIQEDARIGCKGVSPIALPRIESPIVNSQPVKEEKL